MFFGMSDTLFTAFHFMHKSSKRLNSLDYRATLSEVSTSIISLPVNHFETKLVELHRITKTSSSVYCRNTYSLVLHHLKASASALHFLSIL